MTDYIDMTGYIDMIGFSLGRGRSLDDPHGSI